MTEGPFPDARLLKRREVAKPWGRDALPAPFERVRQDRIGEIWFEDDSDDLPLMIKYLFTGEKLSIQVHPSDELAQSLGLSSGKEECWLILDAEPDAVLGIGTISGLSDEQLRVTALSGEIEALMNWVPVRKGDFFYIPAGTVHAIGAGITLVEVQQNTDITYRLYDYGRPRDLHLDLGIMAAIAQPYDYPGHSNVAFETDAQLVCGPKFNLWLAGSIPEGLRSDSPIFVAPLAGELRAEKSVAKAGDCLICGPETEIAPSADCRMLVAQAV